MTPSYVRGASNVATGPPIFRTCAPLGRRCRWCHLPFFIASCRIIHPPMAAAGQVRTDARRIRRWATAWPLGLHDRLVALIHCHLLRFPILSLMPPLRLRRPPPFQTSWRRPALIGRPNMSRRRWIILLLSDRSPISLAPSHGRWRAADWDRKASHEPMQTPKSPRHVRTLPQACSQKSPRPPQYFFSVPTKACTRWRNPVRFLNRNNQQLARIMFLGRLFGPSLIVLACSELAELSRPRDASTP